MLSATRQHAGRLAYETRRRRNPWPTADAVVARFALLYPDQLDCRRLAQIGEEAASYGKSHRLDGHAIDADRQPTDVKLAAVRHDDVAAAVALLCAAGIKPRDLVDVVERCTTWCHEAARLGTTLIEQRRADAEAQRRPR